MTLILLSRHAGACRQCKKEDHDAFHWFTYPRRIIGAQTRVARTPFDDLALRFARRAGCSALIGRSVPFVRTAKNPRNQCSAWIREVMVLVLPEPLAEEEHARHCRHCGEDAAMQLVERVVHFERLNRSRKLAEERDNIWETQALPK